MRVASALAWLVVASTAREGDRETPGVDAVDGGQVVRVIHSLSFEHEASLLGCVSFQSRLDCGPNPDMDGEFQTNTGVEHKHTGSADGPSAYRPEWWKLEPRIGAPSNRNDTRRREQILSCWNEKGWTRRGKRTQKSHT